MTRDALTSLLAARRSAGAALDRRAWLQRAGGGVGALALAWLEMLDQARGAPVKPTLERPTYDLQPKPPAAPPKARAMIVLFMQGGPSHVDLFDPKPELARRHLQTYSGELKFDNAAQASAKLFASPWKFSRHGRVGMELSELVPHLGGVADEITLVRSMQTGVNNHVQGIRALNSCRPISGGPSLGSWVTYALGAESQELPAYVVLTDPGGVPVDGVHNWTNGWLPSLYQGTVVRPREPRILNLDPPPGLTLAEQQRRLGLLRELNAAHLAERPGESELEARIASYELAARMQVAAKEAVDLNRETAATQALYGLDKPATQDFGARCLIARRLVERGVRFVMVATGNQHWDHHNNIRNSLPRVCERVDQPCAALVRDLRQRGLLDTTLVQWGGEMGRLPVIQNEANVGRDHNTYGFSIWMAGGGVKAGHVHGATDEVGHRAAVDPVSHLDYHQTVFHLLGLDPAAVTFPRNGREQTLTDGQPGRVVQEILA